MPNHILNIEGLGKGEKMLLSHIFSFGRKGCWQSNETMGKMFFRSERTISVWVANLKKGRYILWLHPKGNYRTLWAKTHPDVKGSDKLLYRKQEISKTKVISGQIESEPLRRKLPSECAENCEVSAQKPVVPLRRKLLHTNNTIKKETTKDTTATPTPLPAGGQASALLVDRKAESIARIERWKKSFGWGARRQTPELTAAECEQRRQEQRRALLATGTGEKS